MILDKYKKFKTLLSNKDSYYEQNSISNNLLFGLEDYFSEKYLSGNYDVDIDFYNKSVQELSEVLLKYKYVYGYLSSIENRLIKENEKLDEEFFQLQHVSTKGQSFLNMLELPEYYNHVVDYDIIYRKNLNIVSNDVIKTNESLSPISFYLTYHNLESFFINFDSLQEIQDIYIEFYNKFTFSIFGVKSDDTMESIHTNVSSENKFFINTNSNKYKKLFITGVGELNNYIKEIKIFSYSKKEKESNGFIIYHLKDIDNLKQFVAVSDSTTKLYAFNKEEYSKVMELLMTNESLAIERYLNNEYIITKNECLDCDVDKCFILDFFNNKNTISNLLTFYGKEK